MKKKQTKQRSYSKESAKNFVSLTVVQIATFLLGLISRGVFLRTLGNEYLGISGLYSSLLLVLSLAEFGVGEALTYAYIQAFADNNKKIIKEIYIYSKKIFRVIVTLVSLIGFMLMPLIPLLVRESVFQENLYYFYLFFLINTVCSYVIGPYSVVFGADQRVRVVSVISFFTSFIVTILQIISLLLFGDYYIYLFIMVLGNAISFFFIRCKFKKDYKWIYEGSIQAKSNCDIKELLFFRMKDTFVVKLSGTIMESIDNICISRFFGFALVGRYNNYTVIKGTLRTAAKNIYTSIFSSVGVMNAQKSNGDKERLYSHILFVFHYIGAVFSICTFVLTNDFIPIWMNYDSLLPITIALFISIDLYLNILLYAPSNFIQTTEALHFVRIGFVLTAVCNLTLSIILGYKYGIVGVLIATPVSRVLFCFPSYVKNLYYHVFKKSVMHGVKLLLLLSLQTVLVGTVEYIIFRMIPINNLGLFLLKAISSFALCILLLTILNIRNQSLKILYEYIKKMIIIKCSRR